MLTHLTADGNSYEYRYDGLWGRRARIENSVETRYVFGLAETDSSGNITAYYVYGFGLISKITPTKEAYYYHYDGIASTIGITDSSGNMVNKYAYDAFGKILNQEEAIPNPFKYVGGLGVMDEGNGLLYMWARYYDPEMGRFINKDPIGFLGGLNLYTYVRNNPVNYGDPFGLKPLLPAPIGPGYYGGGPGQTIGGVIGWYVGATVGGSIGTNIGVDLGMTYGALIGLPAGPLGSFAGALVGGFVGGAIGGLAGGMAGGYLGRLIGHQFDRPWDGLLNYGEEDMLGWQQYSKPCN